MQPCGARLSSRRLPPSRTRRRRVALGLAVLALLGCAIGVWLFAPEAPIPRRAVDWEAQRRGPLARRSVYWVGHSLMHSRAGPRNVIEEVGRLAEAAGLSYRAYDHTFWGAPLSLNWTGAARTFERSEPAALERRRELEERGERYDALVMTEAVPVGPTMEGEAGSFYAQRFYCAAVRASPDVDVYVYESWTEYDELAPFLERLRADRPRWERLADEAASGRVPAPDRLARLAPYWTAPEPACEGPPIHLVPVGRALLRLARALERRPDEWRVEGGRRLAIRDLLANAPGPDGALPHPDRDPDRVHPSALGTYLAGLVHFATLYRREPPEAGEGRLAPETDARLRALVWRVVRDDPRAGVAGY